MSIIIGLVVTLLIAWFGDSAIKKFAKGFYIGAMVLSVIAIAVTWTGVDLTFPPFVQNNIWSLLSRGALGTAIFIIVMMTGALKNGSNAIKRLMPIRTELSIIASILILGHNVSYGKTYFVLLFTRPDIMPVNQILAAISSIIMIVIMVPLMITSFATIRRKMNGLKWKKLQRLAYIFYALTYVHVLLLCIPQLSGGKLSYLVSIIVYTAVYVVYLYMRLRKALLLKKATRTRWVSLLCIVLVAAVVAMTCGSWSAGRDNRLPNEDLLAMEMEDSSADEETSTLEESEDLESETEPEAETETETLVEETDEEVTELEETEQAEPETDNNKTNQTTSKGTQSSSESTKEPEKLEEQKPEEPKIEEPKPEEPKIEEPEKPAESEKSTTVYKDGTFKGTAYGYKSNITVAVTISNDKITNVSVVSQDEDALYWAMAKDVMGKIVSAQSTNVDAVSGATISSNAIKKAAANALASAKN